MKRVNVLMSTYNGEKYLDEQIQSIIGQKNVETYLYIRDDGSTDSTVNIIKKYVSERIVFIGAGNLGVGYSFMTLLQSSSEADYYAFADQDDIWDTDKLSFAVRAIDDRYEPVLYCCNQRIVDKNAIFIRNRFNESYQPGNLINTVFRNYLSGCTFVMNRVLQNIIIEKSKNIDGEFFNKFCLHDTWTLCSALSCGEVIYDSIPHMSFRRHGENVTDEHTVFDKKGKSRFIWKKIKKMYSGRLAKNGQAMIAKQLINHYNEKYDEEIKRALVLLANYPNSLKSKIDLIRSGIIKQYSLENQWICYFRVLIDYL